MTRQFAAALFARDFEAAADVMNRETAVRRELTPAVLDATGEKLAAAAIDARCGARFNRCRRGRLSLGAGPAGGHPAAGAGLAQDSGCGCRCQAAAAPHRPPRSGG